ncbi:hypothetical protein D3C86_1454510 [compost metagenome]
MLHDGAVITCRPVIGVRVDVVGIHGDFCITWGKGRVWLFFTAFITITRLDGVLDGIELAAKLGVTILNGIGCLYLPHIGTCTAL